MAAKARLMNHPEMEQKILNATEPRKMKGFGRLVKVNGVDDFDFELWEANKEDMVFKLNLAKYSQNPELKRELLKTYPTVLAEASKGDKIWGIGFAKTDPRALDQSKWG